MLLWIAMAVLAAATAVALLAPLYRAERRAAEQADAAAIYRDQLLELEREVETGLVGAGEAEAARVELSRRLLAAADERAGAVASGPFLRRAAMVTAVAAPLLAVALYVAVGSPSMPDRPLQARLQSGPETDGVDIATLVARVEEHLAANPDDGRGWEVVAPVYARMGRFDEAANAFAEAIRILGSTPGREASRGEALIWADNGLINEEARAAFTRAVALDPGHVRSRFYLARALQQDGDTEAAAAAWQALIAEAPAGAAWVPAAQAALAELGVGGGAPLAAGPTSGDVAAAAAMVPEERLAMIEGMVASLAERLQAEPEDAEGWVRLIRSYAVLDRPAAAAAALGDARAALAGDAGALRLVEATARDLGVTAGGSSVP